MKRSFPELFRRTRILPVDDYPSQLWAMLASVSRRPGDEPEIVVLTPGICNWPITSTATWPSAWG